MIWPAQAAADQGYPVEVFYGDGDRRGRLMPLWRDVQVAPGVTRPVVVGLAERPECDVIVIQRPLRLDMVALIPHLQRAGVAVVVEVDDDFDAIDPRNVAYRAVDPQVSPHRNRRHLAMACDIADWVIVTTPALARRYGKHGRVSIIPNYVPARYLDIAKPGWDGTGPPIVGWTGSVATHPGDLRVIGGALAELVRRDVVQFRCIGTGAGVAEELGLDDRYRPYHPVENPTPWWAAGWLDLHTSYPEAVATFDIGLVPLTLTPFNEAKSTLKGLEYAATGSGFVAAPTGPYREMRGPWSLIAQRPRDWRACIRALAADPAGAGEAMREWVRDRELVIEARTHEWVAAWQAAADRRAAVMKEAVAS